MTEVRVHGDDARGPLPVGVGHSLSERRTQTPPVSMDGLNPLLLLTYPPEEPLSAIGGTIVYNDDSPIGINFQQVRYEDSDIVLFIEGWYNNPNVFSHYHGLTGEREGS